MTPDDLDLARAKASYETRPMFDQDGDISWDRLASIYKRREIARARAIRASDAAMGVVSVRIKAEDPDEPMAWHEWLAEQQIDASPLKETRDE